MTNTAPRFHRALFPLAVAIAVGAAWSAASRADAPPGRYTIQSGTVHDTATKLTWQRATAAGTFDWNAATSYCAALDLDGTGWRLPSVKELSTLIDESRQSPAVDPAAFPDTPPGPYWSLYWSSSATPSALQGRGVNLAHGDTFTTSLIETLLVRCVR